MTDEERQRAHEETHQAWNRNAAYWDGRMGEGNDFVEVVSWPATERLLAVQPGERILDVACGNGLTSRRLAALGAEVVAFDFAREMIDLARQRTTEHADHISYRVLDGLEERAFVPDHPQGEHLSWDGRFSEIPPVLVTRMRL